MSISEFGRWDHNTRSTQLFIWFLLLEDELSIRPTEVQIFEKLFSALLVIAWIFLNIKLLQGLELLQSVHCIRNVSDFIGIKIDDAKLAEIFNGINYFYLVIGCIKLLKQGKVRKWTQIMDLIIIDIQTNQSWQGSNWMQIDDLISGQAQQFNLLEFLDFEIISILKCCEVLLLENKSFDFIDSLLSIPKHGTGKYELSSNPTFLMVRSSLAVNIAEQHRHFFVKIYNGFWYLCFFLECLHYLNCYNL